MSGDCSLLVCDAALLLERGKGIRFPVIAFGHATTGFVVRYDGKPFAYLNRCAHVPIELDWSHGDFFESGGLYLMCATHGAVYQPDTGLCAGGPCRGARLRAISVSEHEGGIWWQPDDIVRAPGAEHAS
jgi:nitrite reductase/ring-hydroxylating ferredoxin subunit